MQSTSWETWDWKKHKLESRLPGGISITSDCRWHHPYGRKLSEVAQSCLTLRPHRRQPMRLHRSWDSPGKNTGVGCHFLLQCMKVKSESEVVQSCLTLSDPMDCSLPGSSVHGTFQARVLEWSVIAFSVYAEYIMRNAWLEETQAGFKIAGRNIKNLRYAEHTTLMAESEEELKSLLMKVKEESEKIGLKLNIQKMKIMASGPITSWKIDEETVETVSDYFLGLQNHCRWWLQPWN